MEIKHMSHQTPLVLSLVDSEQALCSADRGALAKANSLPLSFMVISHQKLVHMSNKAKFKKQTKSANTYI
jgi:hypothetical protein